MGLPGSVGESSKHFKGGISKSRDVCAEGYIRSVLKTTDCMYSSRLGSAAERAGVTEIREIESHAACEANFSRLRKWLEQCRSNHEICSLERIQTTYWPLTHAEATY